MIDLQTFIRETIVQICSGVTDAAEIAFEKGAIINPNSVSDTNHRTFMKKGFARSVHDIEFDVALTTTEGKGTEGGIGVMVGSIGLGTKGKSDSAASSTSRVKFTVPVALPASDNDTGRMR